MHTPLRLGVIADTHNLLRPEALDALRGCQRILHLGDIGQPAILDGLRQLAPLDVVRGNNDTAAWAEAIPETLALELGGLRLYLIHDLKQLALDPRAEGFDLVLAGHSHKPSQEVRDGVLYLNPGSAGPRRFKLPIALAILTIADGHVDVDMLTLTP
ncbi:metallophosphoesterase family protein [Pseudomonas citronellolis]|uniref:metallophosphoesterase family protein n=1 Tax=Pseudomonas citronellolis TaxID=53408 RepID=UPI0023E3BB12|nr:metallophosphoesterase family protein [Pseudomonas citronellolis]MDF3935292.1 metallophosphoesterase family protein [Pseudomonas citronellolis]